MAITDKAAKAQSRRLERLGIDVTPQRLQELHSGAPAQPGEFDTVRPTKDNAWIRQGVTPEQHAERRIKREWIAIGAALVVLTICAFFAALHLVGLLF